MKLAALTLALTLTASATAQTFTDPANLRGESRTPLTGRELPIDQGPTGLAQLLRKLNTRASILNIVAHPDDEDGGMLTLYARGLGARVTDLSLTRGEGGQNAVTGDFEDALGLLRTQELLSNDRYTGVTQMFGTEVDFGFSKTKEEAFAKWTHDRVLYDAVRAIRLVRPLVITATFVGGVTDGHGQHQVSGQIAQEAFKAAADPTIFPDQIAEGLLPWQALKVYARVPFADINSKGVFDYATGQYVPAHFVNYVTGKVTTAKPNADVDVPEGDTDPILLPAAANSSDIPSTFAASPNTPLSYAQFARIGLRLQRSQISKNMTLPVSGSYDSGYTLYGSVLCNAPADARFLSPSSKSVILSEARSAQSKDPCIPPAAALPPAPFLPKDLTTGPNFFTNIDTSIESIATLAPHADLKPGLAKLSASINYAISKFNPQTPNTIAPQLAEALHQTDLLLVLAQSISNSTDQQNVLHELRIKHAQLNDALALSLGLTLDATTSAAQQPTNSAVIVVAKLRVFAPDSSLPIKQIWLQPGDTPPLPPSALSDRDYEEQAHHAVADGRALPDTPGHKEIPDLTSDRPVIRSLHAAPHDTQSPTRPYFTRTSIETPVYTLHEADLRNAPAAPPALIAYAIVDFRGTEIHLAHIVEDNLQPLQLVPAYSLALSSHAQVAPLPAHDISFSATITAAIPPQRPTTLPITINSSGLKPQVNQTTVPGSSDFHLKLASTQPTLFTASTTINGQKFNEGYRPVGYPGLPTTEIYTPATTRIVPVDLKLPTHHHIAYLPGTGDAVPEALTSIGLAPTILEVSDLTNTNLAQYDTIILGVRTYNAHPDLHGHSTQALLDYVRNGGNVLVQYQTGEFTAADAPYPLSLGDAEKVVDETAPVKLTDAHAPLLATPNQITPTDFNNWIEERGHGFLSTWDPHYTALTETHDPGQAPQRGGLITTTLGKGHWTYVAFALYRQLPEAVPGAYRLFVNLVTP